MTRNTHDMVNDHFGTAKAEQVASGTPTSGYIPIAAGAGVAAVWTAAPVTGVIVQDEGTPLATTGTTLNFTGSGVTASGTGATKTIDIPGSVGSGQWKDSVRVATIANGTLSTAYANGSSVDGVTIATGDRILLKNQTTGAENGIYVASVSGAPTRATDFDAGTEAVGASVYVREGTINQKTTWTVSTTGTITIGSTSIAFSQSGGYFTAPNTATYRLPDAVTSIESLDASAGISLYGSLGQLYSGGGVELDANNATAGGAASAKHYLYGGHGLVVPWLTADPSGANSENGQIYYNETTHKFRGYANGLWVDLN